MKTCSGCKRRLDASAFYGNKSRSDGLSALCRECSRSYDRKRQRGFSVEVVAKRNQLAKVRRERNSKFLAEVCDVPCMDCGNRFPAVCMDFDHVRGEKKDVVSRLACAKAASIKRLKEEIAKCDIVCSNCHRIRTHITRKKVTVVKRIEGSSAL